MDGKDDVVHLLGELRSSDDGRGRDLTLPNAAEPLDQAQDAPDLDAGLSRDPTELREFVAVGMLPDEVMTAELSQSCIEVRPGPERPAGAIGRLIGRERILDEVEDLVPCDAGHAGRSRGREDPADQRERILRAEARGEILGVRPYVAPPELIRLRVGRRDQKGLSFRAESEAAGPPHHVLVLGD